MCRWKATYTLKNDMKPGSSQRYACRPVSRNTSETESGGCMTTVSEGEKGSCVFLVGEKRFRALMPVDTPAALAPLCGILWNVFEDTASHTS